MKFCTHFRKIVLAIAVLLTAQTAKSQILISILFGDQLNSGKMEFGLVGGFSSSTLIGMNDPSYLHSLSLGLFLDYNITEHWIFEFESNVKNKLGARNITGSDLLFDVGQIVLDSLNKTERNIKVIHNPFMISYRLKNGFGLGGGFYGSIVTASRDYFYTTSGFKDITIEQSFTGQLHRLDWGVTGMVHYHVPKMPGMQFRAKVNYGFGNVFKVDNGKDYRNFWITLGVAVPIVIKL